MEMTKAERKHLMIGGEKGIETKHRELVLRCYVIQQHDIQLYSLSAEEWKQKRLKEKKTQIPKLSAP
jgi:hypothetical protein